MDKNRLPKHVSIIMDGNGRWAKLRGKERVYGHFEGVESVRACMETAVELGIDDAAVQKALAEFKGVGRRFQRYGDWPAADGAEEGRGGAG